MITNATRRALLAVVLVCCGGPRTSDGPRHRFTCPGGTTEVVVRDQGVLPHSGPAVSIGLGVCGVVLFPRLEGEVRTCQSPSGSIEGPVAMNTRIGDARVLGQCVANQAEGTWTWLRDGRVDITQHYQRGTLIGKQP